MRKFSLTRETSETKIVLDVNLDEYNSPSIIIPNKFLTHMLEQLAFHGNFTINLNAKSSDDDPHHIIEDVAIAFGKAINHALDQKHNIERYGSTILPMDEALILTSIDISGRSFLSFEANFKYEHINDMPSEMIMHFFESFAYNCMCTLHIKQLNGSNDHHVAEAIFKSFGRTLRKAWSLSTTDGNKIPSTKGVL